MPPYLAGREIEQRLFADVLADLADGAPAPAEVLLYGPRGNGKKTVLLRWIEEEVEPHHPVDVVSLPAAAIPDEAELAERLLPSASWERLTPAEVSGVGLGWRPGREKPPPVDTILAARAR